MEIVDELMTPGCPQCAVKHLSAALYHRAHLVGGGEDLRPDQYMVEICTAYINLVEVRAGYLSHLWYAVGALVRAEERMAPLMVGGSVAREARLVLEHGGVEALVDALKIIEEGTVPDHADWAAAHFDEARRELPAFAEEMRMDDLVGSIERIRKEFFITDQEAPADSENGAEKGGETDMATKKLAKKAPAFLKKEDPKAKKAACKGGKTACKKGKCK